MNRGESPPVGYYVTDYESEIRDVCAFLENQGMRYRLINEFEIQYISDEVVIYIIFERNSDAVSVEYSLPSNPSEAATQTQPETYSIGWTIAEYLDGKLKSKYLPEKLTKLEKIMGCVRFFQDYRSLLLDKEFANELRAKYDKLLI